MSGKKVSPFFYTKKWIFEWIFFWTFCPHKKWVISKTKRQIDLRLLKGYTKYNQGAVNAFVGAYAPISKPIIECFDYKGQPN